MTIIEYSKESRLLIYTVVFLLVLILEFYAMKSTSNNNEITFVILTNVFNLCGIL